MALYQKKFILYINCTNSVPIVHQHCTNTLPTLYQHCSNTVPTLMISTNTLATLCQYCTNTDDLHQHCNSNIELYHHWTNTALNCTTTEALIQCTTVYNHCSVLHTPQLSLVQLVVAGSCKLIMELLYWGRWAGRQRGQLQTLFFKLLARLTNLLFLKKALD